MKPRLLDLFCGAGGAAMGYHRAGFDVVGVDIEPQPNYPFEFVQADALGYLENWIDEYPPQDPYPTPASMFAAIHASPPCQAYTTGNNKHPGVQAAHPALIDGTRDLLVATGLPYVIENVVGARAHLRDPIRLCGRSLGLAIHRHRLFECSFPVMAPPCVAGRDPFGIYGRQPDRRRLRTRIDGTEYRAAGSVEEARDAMGMPWVDDWHGVKEAIPPAYTELLGPQLLAHLWKAAA